MCFRQINCRDHLHPDSSPLMQVTGGSVSLTTVPKTRYIRSPCPVSVYILSTRIQELDFFKNVGIKNFLRFIKLIQYPKKESFSHRRKYLLGDRTFPRFLYPNSLCSASWGTMHRKKAEKKQICVDSLSNCSHSGFS